MEKGQVRILQEPEPWQCDAMRRPDGLANLKKRIRNFSKVAAFLVLIKRNKFFSYFSTTE
jgi:hypothetical protein